MIDLCDERLGTTVRASVVDDDVHLLTNLISTDPHKRETGEKFYTICVLNFRRLKSSSKSNIYFKYQLHALTFALVPSADLFQINIDSSDFH